ncbi:MAG: M20 metallopeptidase family protein [Candidatus Heimdallarchaeota archaeon]
MKKEIWKIANEIKEELVTDRRHFHMYPELGFEEHQTAAYVAKKLKELGLEVKIGVAKTGVIALLKGKGGTGKTIGIRADMDALPIQEENDVSYKSKHDGKAHMCGHDAHTAILLGVAKILSRLKEQLPGNVKFFFQPAEEGLGGARPMVEAGALADPEVSAVIALHVFDEYDTGKVVIKDGSFTASADKFYIDITGKGGHAAAPHETVDPIVVASHLVVALQTVASRSTDPVDPVVVTVGTFHAGSAYNIIPETAHLSGTIRALKQDVREATWEQIKQITEGVAKSFGATIATKIDLGYNPGFNDPSLNQHIKNAVIDLFGEDQLVIEEEPTMGAEDFYDFSDNYRIPVSMFWLGTRNEEKGIKYPGHSPKFDVDEDALPVGSAVLALTAWNYLAK